MDILQFLRTTDGSRIFLIGELHQNPSDTAAVLYLLGKMVAAGKRLHFFVEYFDSNQNEVIQPHMVEPEFHAKPHERAGTTPADIQHLIDTKIWPARYFGDGRAQTFADSWMHKQELGKIKMILMFANQHRIPVKGFDLPLDRGSVGQEFPSRIRLDYLKWDRGRDTWMAHHLQSFMLNDDRIAVAFVGAAHCAGIKYGTRKNTIGLQRMLLLEPIGDRRIITLCPNFEIEPPPTSASELITRIGTCDYELHPSALASTLRLTPAQAYFNAANVAPRGG